MSGETGRGVGEGKGREKIEQERVIEKEEGKERKRKGERDTGVLGPGCKRERDVEHERSGGSEKTKTESRREEQGSTKERDNSTSIEESADGVDEERGGRGGLMGVGSYRGALLAGQRFGAPEPGGDFPLFEGVGVGVENEGVKWERFLRSAQG
eukprot:763429-Hanusia_phi.AAC.1